MKTKQLFDLIVTYAKGNLEHDSAFPNVGMGMSVARAVENACESVSDEARRWDRTVAISSKLKKEVVDYLSKTKGELPFLDTWDGWKKHSRYVVKGQKATTFNAGGKALFGYWQVTTQPPKTSARYSDDWDYDFTQPSYYKEEPEPETVYYADGSGYVNFGGPCGPLYFDRNGES